MQYIYIYIYIYIQSIYNIYIYIYVYNRYIYTIYIYNKYFIATRHLFKILCPQNLRSKLSVIYMQS